MYLFNLLVSFSYNFMAARREIVEILTRMGDKKPVVRRTLVRGLIGVRTELDPHVVVTELGGVLTEKPKIFRFTRRWNPVDLWTLSDVPSMKEGVRKVARIGGDERWRMVVEKRRYTAYHTEEIIRELAELVDVKVDLMEPTKILRIDILGSYAGISLLKPNEVFSAVKRTHRPESK